jgi:hypothetical protein
MERQAEQHYLDEKQDILELEEERRQESKRLSRGYVRELEQFRWSERVPPSEHQSDQYLSVETEAFTRDEGQGLSTAELLSQLMVYSDDETNEKAIKVLVNALSHKYQRELADYENQGGQLKETVESLEKEKHLLQAEVHRASEEIREKNEII